MSERQPNDAGPDDALRDALRKAYTERAKLFVRVIRRNDVRGLIESVSGHPADALHWELDELGIGEKAFEKLDRAGIDPHMVFCHPTIVDADAKALEYYRNLAALSRKGLGQMVRSLRGQQRKAASIRAINQILSSIVEDTVPLDLALIQAVIPAEMGAELQGTWVNMIGQGAAKRVQEIITQFVDTHQLAQAKEKIQTDAAKRRTETHIRLSNRWTIIFGAEPDISIRDPKKKLRGAIEIKGSMDRAGAQTRYGEAKKSFAKTLAEYARCDTIYLASCFTDAVVDQIDKDAQVRRVFNLVDILANDAKRQEFLDEIFKHLIRIDI